MFTRCRALLKPQSRQKSTSSGPVKPEPVGTRENEDEEEAFWRDQPIQQPSISRAVVYFIAFSTFAFGVSAYASLRETDRIAKRTQGAFPASVKFVSSQNDEFAEICWGPGVSEPKMIKLTELLWAQEASQGYQWLRESIVPSVIKAPLTEAYKFLANKILALRIDKQIVMPIIFINSTVLLLWTLSATKRGARLHQFMRVNFTHRPSSGLTHTMLTSTFSHNVGWHFLFNNIALWSFGGSALFLAARQQNISGNIPESWPGTHFLAFFAVAGVFASMTSHIGNAFRFQTVLRTYGLQAAKKFGRVGSVGSSGAIWALIAMTACVNPDSGISLIFLPFFSFPIKYGVAGLLALDVVGLVRGWRLFDHVAHLGGAFFGFAYYQYGLRFWAAVKQWVAKAMEVGPYDPARRKH